MRLIKYFFLVVVGVLCSCTKQNTEDTAISSVKEIANVLVQKKADRTKPFKRPMVL